MDDSGLGVCSWSLQPTSLDELIERIRACGVSSVQFGLDLVRTPIDESDHASGWNGPDVASMLEKAGISVSSGMMMTHGEDYSSLTRIQETGGLRPGETWERNQRITEACAEHAELFGVSLVTYHAGFLPHGDDSSAIAERNQMIERILRVGEIFGARGIRTALETGQEDAETLLDVMTTLRAMTEASNAEPIGVNFDPANMILYAMGDPVDALEILQPFVMQVHIKDALPTTTPGTWGEEVPVGKGAVDWERFVAALGRFDERPPMYLEREAGIERVRDLSDARAFFETLVAGADANV